MSDPKKFALYGGIVMLVMGVLALVPNLYWGAADLPGLNVEYSYGYFLGTFAMNIFNKAALIVLGLLGIAASSWRNNSLPMSIKYSRLVMVIMAALAVLGMFEQTNTLFGYLPLFGYEIAIHGLFAVLGGYFGYRLTSMVPHTYERNQTNGEKFNKHHFKMPHFRGH